MKSQRVPSARVSLTKTDLFKVSPHDDNETGPASHLGLEQLGVGLGLLRIMDGAGPDNDQETVIRSCDDGASLSTSLSNGSLGSLREGHLVGEKCGLDERLVLCEKWSGRVHELLQQ